MSHESVLELQIVRVEGFDYDITSLGCYVSLDDQVLDVITPINSQHDENKITIPIKGFLKFIVKSMSTDHEFVGSICLPVDILPSKGYLWLPLFSDSEPDVLTYLPEESDSPRLLVSLNKTSRAVEVPYIDMTENAAQSRKSVDMSSDSHISSANSSLKNSITQGKYSRIENQFDEDKFRFTSEIRWHDESSADIEKFRIQYRKQLALQEDLTKCLVSCQSQLSCDRKNKEALESVLNDMKVKHEAALNKSQSREKSLLKLLEIKDSELRDLQGDLRKLQTLYRNLEGEKMHLEEKNEKLELESVAYTVTDKNEELQNVYAKLEQSEAQRKNLQESLIEIGKE